MATQCSGNRWTRAANTARSAQSMRGRGLVRRRTATFGFTLNTSAAPAFADVVRGHLRLLLSGPTSSGARATPRDAATAGRNRIHLIVDDLDAEITRLHGAGLPIRSDLITGPGGRQILLADPDGNLIELFQPAHHPATTTPITR
jgi:catechol 2,3-dioxygenase-like lactoylglutathione lyase family enzyme